MTFWKIAKFSYCKKSSGCKMFGTSGHIEYVKHISIFRVVTLFFKTHNEYKALNKLHSMFSKFKTLTFIKNSIQYARGSENVKKIKCIKMYEITSLKKWQKNKLK